jgi:hypothetical protein
MGFQVVGAPQSARRRTLAAHQGSEPPGEGIAAEDMKILPWLEPQLVAEVQFTDRLWLPPSCHLVGMRNNKEPNKVTREQI